MRLKLCIATFVLVIAFGVFAVFTQVFTVGGDYATQKQSAKKDTFDYTDNKTEENTKYFITLEGDTICAYKETDNKRKLIHSKAFQTMLADEKEVEKLKGGIYAESYEDMVLYFESYLS